MERETATGLFIIMREMSSFRLWFDFNPSIKRNETKMKYKGEKKCASYQSELSTTELLFFFFNLLMTLPHSNLSSLAIITIVLLTINSSESKTIVNR